MLTPRGPCAFLFPGQGSQMVGMGRALCERYPQAQEVFAAADRALGFPISTICFEGPEETLRLTAYTQPAILTVSVAAFRILESRNLAPDFVAGHSLGEYSALVAAGSLALEDAVRAVHQRGKYMQEAVPVGTGAMAAIFGLEPGLLEEVCREAAQGEIVSPANFNSPQQIVIAGHKQAVERAIELARHRGVRRGVLLPVSAPFHCDLMMPAQLRLKADLEDVPFADARCPLINNVEALPVDKASAIREGLIRQVTAPVRWQESMEWLLRRGIVDFIEVGPGQVLTGLLRKVRSDLRLLNVEDCESLEQACRELAAG